VCFPRHHRSRLRHAVGACAIALAIGLIVAPGAHAAAAWLTPTDISRPGQHLDRPDLALDAAGDAVAIWNRRNGAGELVIEAASRPAGGAWSTPTALSAPGAGAFQPQIAVNGAGDAVAVWVGTAGGIEAAARPANGTWSTQSTRLSPPGGLAVEPQLALNAAGDAVAVWTQVTGGNRTAEAAVRPAGGDWSTQAIQISPTGKQASEARVGLDARGEAVAIWRSDSAGARPAIETASRPVGGAWSTPPTGLSDPAFIANDQPQLAVNPAGEAVAVWRVTKVGNRTFLEFAGRLPGRAWVPLGPADDIGSSPQIAINPKGDAVAVWTGNDPNGNVIEAALEPALGGWGAHPVKLSDPSTQADGPDVAIDAAGDTVAIWRRAEGGTTVIETASRRFSGAWSAPTKLTGPEPTSPEFPQISLDAAGDGLAVWKHNLQTDSVIRTAAYDATPPQLRSLAIPPTAVAGEPLSLSVAPFDAFSTQVSTQWNFGDGSGSSPGATVNHTYAAPGTYTVTATATDQAFNSASATATIAVQPGHPKAVVARTGKLRGARALLRLSCPITGPCQGTARLSIRRGAKRMLLLGKHAFGIAAGTSLVLAIKLRSAARRLLAAAPRKALVARVDGTGVTAATVRLRR
jgi:PKD domain